MPLFLLSPPVFGFPTPKQQAVESISLPYPHPLQFFNFRRRRKWDGGRVWLTKIWSIFIKLKLYLGMVTNRPTLTNNYVKLHYLLGTSKTLNTCDSQIQCNKVKDITMNNQQETKNSHLSPSGGEGCLSSMQP